jgi:hypothetical protein
MPDLATIPAHKSKKSVSGFKRSRSEPQLSTGIDQPMEESIADIL